jgi:hypothetical protein
MISAADRSIPNKEETRSALLLGRAWLERGRTETAAKYLEKAYSMSPDCPQVLRSLAYLQLHQERLSEAADSMRLATKNELPDSPLHREAQLMSNLAGQSPRPVELPDNPAGRLRFTSRYDRTHHRSGWRYAITALESLHNSQGVLFEGFLEEPFAWQHHREGVRPGPELLKALNDDQYETRLTSEELRIVPYREPWVGFLHNPPAMPAWFHGQEAPQTIFKKSVWQESLQHCIGLFALSEYAADWLRQETRKPVSAVLHPSETPSLKFDFERFLANPDKRVVQIGWWLRRLAAIYRLPIASDNPAGYTKLCLLPQFFDGADDYLREIREGEFEREGRPESEHSANTKELTHVPDDEYDQLLSENICFVNLYDASANNAVIECLVRGTPILVNPLPAVQEYLGADYPFYYQDLDDAAAMSMDTGRLRAAHEYLNERAASRCWSAESFRKSVEDSEVYGLL